MADDRVRFRLDISKGELEMEGESGRLVEWFARLSPYLDAAETPEGRPDHPKVNEHRESGMSPTGVIAIPSTFGEFYHSFPKEMTDSDRVLVAGYYLQRSGTENRFTTADANDLLRQQGIKLANASQAVRRNLSAQRAFAVEQGAFRVSASGVDQLKAMASGAEQS